MTPSEAYTRMQSIITHVNMIMSAFRSEQFLSEADAVLAYEGAKGAAAESGGRWVCPAIVVSKQGGRGTQLLVHRGGLVQCKGCSGSCQPYLVRKYVDGLPAVQGADRMSTRWLTCNVGLLGVSGRI